MSSEGDGDQKSSPTVWSRARFVEHQEVDPDEIDEISPDCTVGMVSVLEPDKINGDVRFDIRRLRRALLAFEDEFDGEVVELGIATRAGHNSFPLLIMTEPEGSQRAVALAPRRFGDYPDGQSESDAETLVTAEEA